MVLLGMKQTGEVKRRELFFTASEEIEILHEGDNESTK